MIKNDAPDESKTKRYIAVVIIVLVVLGFNYIALTKHVSSNSVRINDVEIQEEDMEKNRNPAVAGIFYSKDKKRLDSEVEHYLSADYEAKNFKPKMLIVPHAGYQYSGPIAAKAYSQLKKHSNQIRRVVLVGPAHRVGFRGVAVSGADNFVTPLGKVKVNKKMVDEILKYPQAKVFDEAHKDEHSIEVQLPFLQKTLNRFSILPLVYGDIEPEALAEALVSFVDRSDTIIIFSADLSHYYDYDIAQKIDGNTAELINTNKPLDEHMSCGAIGINTALIIAQKDHLHPELLDLANSGDTSGDKNRVVGYGAWMFGEAEEKEEKELTKMEQEIKNLNSFVKKYGKDLLAIANRSLEDAVLKDTQYSPSRDEYNDDLFNQGSSFVTLMKGQDLRGCIGTIVPNQAVSVDVADNAHAAAMRDTRFQPVTAEELPYISVSISLLTDFERVKFKSEQDLLDKIAAGLDGLILRDGNRQGVLLPSVWEIIPDKKEFLNQLKLKAGLAPSYWSDKIKVYRFRTVEIGKNEN